MAIKKPESPKQSESEQAPSASKGRKTFLETLVDWTLKVALFPFSLVTIIFHQMLTPGATGSTFLGKLMFIFLVVLSSDGYWQILFQGSPLFPWYENQWTGWGWLPGMALSLTPPSISAHAGLLASPLFYICVGISFVIQSFQSAAFNGSKFANADKKVIGAIAVALWTFDFILTIASRNPWGFEDPGVVLQCIMFNVFTIFCAELGRWGEKVLSGK
ncbi:hypothetical protein NIES2107_15760 [Nostoc carneum NIES-2107]|nr:hypothetical protein NIES2107_15760 [Nostoc carneum NIES-2107]